MEDKIIDTEDKIIDVEDKGISGNPKKINAKEIRSWGLIICIALTLAFLINSKAYAKVIVDGPSMENTLLDRQQLIVDEISYNFTKPKQGDIITFYLDENKGTVIDDLRRYIDKVIFRDEESHERLIKRVIGVEGDIVDIKDGTVYVNGKELKESYTKGETYLDPDNIQTPVTVGKNELFVLGDHRTVSSDSREFGTIKLSQVEGKAIFRVYPFNKMGKIK